MNKKNSSKPKLVFADKRPDKIPDSEEKPAWKIIIVDDESGVHESTTRALEGVAGGGG